MHGIVCRPDSTTSFVRDDAMTEEKTVWEVNFEDSDPVVVFNKNQRQTPKIVTEFEKPLGPCHLSFSEKL